MRQGSKNEAKRSNLGASCEEREMKMLRPWWDSAGIIAVQPGRALLICEKRLSASISWSHHEDEMS